MAAKPCRHPRTVYNERDETLYCLSCFSWVLPEEAPDAPD